MKEALDDRISFKRLNSEELRALRGFVNTFKEFKKNITFDDVDGFMTDLNKKEGLFDNCSAQITKDAFIVQRPIGW